MPERPSRRVMRLQWQFHRLIWRISGGRLGRRAIGMPVLELVTTGRKSGEQRSILISYLDTPAGPVIAGTNAGADQDPAWAHNLRADAAARVREAGEWRQVRARFLEGEDWEDAWRGFLAHPGYADYREMTDRAIPLVVLETVA